MRCQNQILGMVCIATSHTGSVHTVFTQNGGKGFKITPLCGDKHLEVNITFIQYVGRKSDCLLTFTGVSGWASERDGDGLM